MAKFLTAKTPEELFAEATEGAQLSAGELRLLTAGLAALRKTDTHSLNNIEHNALNGMIAYVAHTQNISERSVSQFLLTKFQVGDLREMPAHHFQTALEYLVDWDTVKSIN